MDREERREQKKEAEEGGRRRRKEPDQEDFWPALLLPSSLSLSLQQQDIMDCLTNRTSV